VKPVSRQLKDGKHAAAGIRAVTANDVEGPGLRTVIHEVLAPVDT